MPQCQYCHAINKANLGKCCRCGKKLEKELEPDRVFQDVNFSENEGTEQSDKSEEPSALVHFSAEIPDF